MKDKWWMSKEDVTRLVESKNDLVRENYVLMEEVNRLKLDNERLKAGNFTEEEFQNLCHTVSVQEGRCRFEQGCTQYQAKLFGEKVYVG